MISTIFFEGKRIFPFEIYPFHGSYLMVTNLNVYHVQHHFKSPIEIDPFHVLNKILQI